jgi:hypothetical protein
MVAKNLNNLVLKTALVGNVTLPAPADHIGSGFVVDAAHYPATFLSLGQFPMPRLPEPEPLRAWREVADVLTSTPSARVPASSVGSPSGAKVSRASDRAARLMPTDPQVSDPGFRNRLCRLGRDCQSPDRFRDDQNHDAKRRTRWHRTQAAATATAK